MTTAQVVGYCFTKMPPWSWGIDSRRIVQIKIVSLFPQLVSVTDVLFTDDLAAP